MTQAPSGSIMELLSAPALLLNMVTILWGSQHTVIKLSVDSDSGMYCMNIYAYIYIYVIVVCVCACLCMPICAYYVCD